MPLCPCAAPEGGRHGSDAIQLLPAHETALGRRYPHPPGIASPPGEADAQDHRRAGLRHLQPGRIQLLAGGTLQRRERLDGGRGLEGVLPGAEGVAD